MTEDRSPRILLVDDDTSLLQLLSMRLEDSGYRVHAVEAAETALANLEAFAPDLVVTDLRMAGMDGLELFARLRDAHPALPVIILTAHGSIPEAVEATRKGAHGFLTKPFDYGALLREIADALAVSGGIEPANEPPRWRSAILTRSPAMEHLLDQVQRAADSDAAVCIHGASGTGKELLARALHDASPRRGAEFVPVNCGAIPENLLESELFGYRAGAFTGATRNHDGLFQQCDGGTLMLDEIGDMPMALQVKLLRVLQDGEVRPVGARRPHSVDVRIVAATHRDLAEEMAAGRFREDLYYRLAVVTLKVPSLDQRREDVPLLANHFLKQLAERAQRPARSFAPDALECLVSAPWPGNVRQLYNLVERLVTLGTTSVISGEEVREALQAASEEGLPPLSEARERFEQEYLTRILRLADGSVSRAARMAGRNRTEFYRLLKRHGIDHTLFRARA
ncbi:MAG: sigma 54-interacting transcriptional regulator [Pseudomonadota bacterium]